MTVKPWSYSDLEQAVLFGAFFGRVDPMVVSIYRAAARAREAHDTMWQYRMQEARRAGDHALAERLDELRIADHRHRHRAEIERIAAIRRERLGDGENPAAARKRIFPEDLLTSC